MSTSPSILLFANPISGAGEGGRIADRLAARLSRAGYRVDVHTEPASSIDGALLKRSTAIAAIVVGGDGPLLTVVHRLLQDFDEAALPPLLTVPLGTANL